MARSPKSAGSKDKKPKRSIQGKVNRRGSEGESPIDPGYPLPSPALSYRDFNTLGQRNVEQAVARAGRSAFGSPISMEDAVATRVANMNSAIARSSSGIPEGVSWYGGHQRELLGISERTGIRPGSVVDATATLSPRNQPSQELLATESAAFIAANPAKEVTITPEMQPNVGTYSKGSDGKLQVTPTRTAGNYRLGDLSPQEVASLGFAETQALKGDNEKAAVPPESRSLDPKVTNVTLRSAGRPRAEKAIRITRGETFSEVTGSAPKIQNYARGIHTYNPNEAAYNAEVLWRRQHGSPDRPHLFAASALLGSHQPLNESVEDYVMAAQTADVAAARGGKATADKAQDLVEPKKTTPKKMVDGKNVGGKRMFPADVTSEEIFHSFNEEATRRTAQQFFADSTLPGGGTVREEITMGAVQPITWVEHRRHGMGADPEYNAEQAAQKAAEMKEQRRKTQVQQLQFGI